jgi:hypothetical protein
MRCGPSKRSPRLPGWVSYSWGLTRFEQGGGTALRTGQAFLERDTLLPIVPAVGASSEF